MQGFSLESFKSRKNTGKVKKELKILGKSQSRYFFKLDMYIFKGKRGKTGYWWYLNLVLMVQEQLIGVLQVSARNFFFFKNKASQYSDVPAWRWSECIQTRYPWNYDERIASLQHAISKNKISECNFAFSIRFTYVPVPAERSLDGQIRTRPVQLSSASLAILDGFQSQVNALGLRFEKYVARFQHK